MLNVSIMDAPIRMGSVGRRACSRGIVLVLPRAFSSEVDTGSREENASNQNPEAAYRPNRPAIPEYFDYTDLCNWAMVARQGKWRTDSAWHPCSKSPI